MHVLLHRRLQRRGAEHLLASLCCLALFSPAEAPAQLDRPWRVYLVPFSHTDVGYTAPVADVIQAHLNTLDSVVAMVARTRSNQPGERFRWTIEIPWVLEFYLAQRTSAQVESLMACVRRGEIEIGGIHFGLQSDLCGNEELVRSLSFAQDLRTRYGVPVRTGLINDTPGFTWSLVQLLAKSDMPYLSVAMNSFLADFYTTTTLPNLFWWQGQDGSKILVWRSVDSLFAYLEGGITCGVYGTPGEMQSKLTSFLQRRAARGYPYNEIFINCATGDNGPAKESVVANAMAWNAAHADAKVIIATVSTFFDTVARQHAGVIPAFAGDAPNWWTWLFAPSATGGYAQSRTAQRLLPAGETFAAMAEQTATGFRYDARVMQSAYVNNLSFEDHNLGGLSASGNIPFWTLKMGWVNAAVDTAQSALDRAVGAMADDIPTGGNPAVVVFNPLAWQRDVPVLFSLSDPLLGGVGAFDLRDGATGIAVPVQVLHDGMAAFLARSVPAMGYRVFRVAARQEAMPSPASMTGLRLQSERLDVSLDPATGSVSSMIDRSTGTEVVSADHQFNQYRFNSTFPPSGMSVRSSDSGGVVQSVTLQGNAQGSASYQTTVRLWSGVGRLECFNRYDKLPAGAVTEAVDWAFHVGLSSPTLRYEIPFGVVRLHDDELSGFRSNHYAARHWINIEDGGGTLAVTVAMDNATVVAAPAGAFNGAGRLLISYGNSSSAYRAGIGPISMNFAVGTNAGGYRADSSMKLAYDFVSPAPVRILAAGQGGTLPDSSFSFLTITPATLSVSTLKGTAPADAVVVRVYNPSARPVHATARFAYPLISAAETSLGEVERHSLSVTGREVVLDLGAYEVKTVRATLLHPLAVKVGGDLTATWELLQNYPNPFNGETRLTIGVASTSFITVSVFDVLGRRVAELARGERAPGRHVESWSARDAAGRPVASGVYYAVFEARAAGGAVLRKTIPMLLLR